MKALILIATWLVCCNIAFGSTANYPSTLFVFDSTSRPFTYQKLISDLRELLKGEKTSHSLPILPTEVDLPVSSNERFVLVHFAVARMAPLLTVALDRIDAGMVGYAIQNQVSYFFNDVSDEIYESPLFNSTIKNKLPYIGCFYYLDLGGLRFHTELGLEALRDAYYQLISYSGVPSTRFERALVVVLQMIKDAVRSKYVEGLVYKNFMSGFVPKFDLILTSDVWTTRSVAIQNSENGLLPEPLLLYQEQEPQYYYVFKVDEVVPTMGLLLGNNKFCGYPILQKDSYIKKVVSV